jgi:hypothetical protein
MSQVAKTGLDGGGMMGLADLVVKHVLGGHGGGLL